MLLSPSEPELQSLLHFSERIGCVIAKFGIDVQEFGDKVGY